MNCKDLGRVALGFALVFSAASKGAAPGSPYLGWGDEGSGNVDAPFFYGLDDDYRWGDVSEAISLPDQSVVVIGNIRHAGGLRIGLAKVTPEGGLDPKFGAYGGFWLGSSLSGWVADAVLDADGQILVSESESICRFNATSGAAMDFSGSDATCVDIDAMAGLDGAKAVGLVALPGGEFWVAAQVYEIGIGWKKSALLRLRADGSLDTTFNGTGILPIGPPPGKEKLLLSGLRQATNGKLVAIGLMDGEEFVAMRFSASGQRENWPAQQADVTMDYHPSVEDFALVDDPASSEDDIVLVNKDAVTKIDGKTGLLVEDFGSNGRRALAHDGLSLRPVKVRVAPDGTLLVATVLFEMPDSEQGIEGDGPFSIVRLLPDGSTDDAFGTDGVSVIDYQGDGDVSLPSSPRAGLVVLPDAVVVARPAGHVSQSSTYDTAFIAKRHLRGDLVFRDGFDP